MLVVTYQIIKRNNVAWIKYVTFPNLCLVQLLILNPPLMDKSNYIILNLLQGLVLVGISEKVSTEIKPAIVYNKSNNISIVYLRNNKLTDPVRSVHWQIKCPWTQPFLNSIKHKLHRFLTQLFRLFWPRYRSKMISNRNNYLISFCESRY